MLWKDGNIAPQAQPKPREDLQTKYKQLAEVLGDKYFQMKTLEAQIYLLQEQMFKLSEEFEKTDKDIKEKLSGL